MRELESLDRRQYDGLELNRAIELGEVEAAIRKLKRTEHVGDGIMNELIINGGKNLRQSILILLRLMWRCESIPEDWKLGLIQPIFKDGDKQSTLNYRPITLLSSIYKLYALIINERITSFVEGEKKLSEEQGGFRKKRGTVDQIFSLSELLNIRKSLKPTFTCFLDFKKAYDFVYREGLWIRLWETGIKGKMWYVIRNI